MTDINELAQRMKAAALKATEGPWIIFDDGWSDDEDAVITNEARDDACASPIAVIKGGGSESCANSPFYAEQRANAEHIATSCPENVVALVEALEALRHERDELQQGFIANQEEAREAIKYATELKEQLARARSGCEEAVREVEGIQKILDHIHRRRVIWRGKAVTADAENAVLRQRIAELEQKADIYDMLREDYEIKGSLVDFVDWQSKRIAELEARDIQPLGVQLITEAIGAHGYIVGCLQQNRPDLALEESLKWVQGISQAAVMATEGE